MKVFVDKKESILTWIIILSFSIGVAGLLGPGLSKTERIIGLVSMLIFAGVSFMREELYDSKKIGDDKSDDEIVFDNGFSVIGCGNDSVGVWDEMCEYEDFLILNQRGFNNALYHHFGDDKWDYRSYRGYSPKKDTRGMVRDCYPKCYPCVMRLYGNRTNVTGRLVAKFEYENKKIKQLYDDKRRYKGVI